MGKNLLWKVKTFEQLSVVELYTIMQLRQEVFVVEQNCPYLDADGYDDRALHLWAEDKGKAVAYVRIFDRKIKYSEPSIGRVVTHPDFRGSKLGRTLMNLAIELVETRFRTPEIRISAQDYLLNFYGSLGFMDTGKKYLEDDIPHTEMLRTKKP